MKILSILIFSLLVIATILLSGAAYGQELVQIPTTPLMTTALPETPQPQKTPCTGWIWQTGLDCQPGHKRQNLVESPSYRRTVDTPFLVFVAISGAAAFTDGYESTHRIKPSNNCYEVNPFLGKRPSAAATYGMTMGTWAGANLFSYWLKRTYDSVVWSMPQTIETIVHVIGINMTLSNCKAGPQF
jgi:hypothetical protein